jgi:surfeit locus 1 family protein
VSSNHSRHCLNCRPLRPRPTRSFNRPVSPPNDSRYDDDDDDDAVPDDGAVPDDDDDDVSHADADDNAAAVELTRSGALGTLVVFVVVAVCLRVGFWQLDRREQRLERNHAIAERLATDPISLDAAPHDTTGLVNRPARLRGRYDHEGSFALIGRSYRGSPGVYIFTPLRLDAGAILVNRGWVPSPDAASVDLAALRPPPDTEVMGVLLAFPDIRTNAIDEGFRARWFRLDGRAIRATYPYPVAPVYLQAAAAEGAADAGSAPVPLGPPDLDAGRHLSYAVQWFSFAAIFLIGWTALMLHRGSTRAPARD